MNITSLPSDVLILVLGSLHVADLAALSQTCRSMNILVTEFGWAGYARRTPRPSYSISRARAHWSPRTCVRYDTMADSAWKREEFVARPLSRPWTGKLQPILAINPSRLVVAAGSNIYSYKFGDSDGESAPPVELEGEFNLLELGQRSRDITAFTFVEDDGLDRTLYAGFQDGTAERVELLPNGDTSISIQRTTVSSCTPTDFLESLTSESNTLLSLFSEGLATLTNLSDPYTQSKSTIDLKTRSWVSHLCLRASGSYAAFGTSSTTPLTVHAIMNDRMSPRPSAVLHTKKSAGLSPDQLLGSAVYGLSSAPISSPWGSSPQILVSGWFDGQVRCYDLRSSLRASSQAAESTQPAPLQPVLTLRNPWSDEPIYSVSCGGGSASHVAAGTARHSVVAFWDVRSPKAGWSVHGPGNDKSPVYSVILESSRFFGVTQSRPFVYDFGPGVTPQTYPPIPPNRDGLEQKKWISRLTYYVTKYPHSRGTPGNEH